MSAVPLWRCFCGGAFVMRTVMLLLGWSRPSRERRSSAESCSVSVSLEYFGQLKVCALNLLTKISCDEVPWVTPSGCEDQKQTITEVVTMYRLGGGGHLGDSMFLQRRATIKDKYAQLRLTHPALHSDLRDFQVNCGCQRLDIALPFWKYYHTETTSAGWHNSRGHWPRGQAPHSELSAHWNGQDLAHASHCLPPSTWWYTSLGTCIYNGNFMIKVQQQCSLCR